MLFYPKDSVIFEYVFYDEPSSTLFFKYNNREIREYYKIDRVFFHQHILPLLREDKECRSMLYWGINHELAIKLDENIPDFDLIDLKHFDTKKR